MIIIIVLYITIPCGIPGTLKFKLRRAAKARVDRMVKPHGSRTWLNVPEWLRAEWKSGNKDEIADVLCNCNFQKDTNGLAGCWFKASMFFYAQWLFNKWVYTNERNLNILYRSFYIYICVCVNGYNHIYIYISIISPVRRTTSSRPCKSWWPKSRRSWWRNRRAGTQPMKWKPIWRGVRRDLNYVKAPFIHTHARRDSTLAWDL